MQQMLDVCAQYATQWHFSFNAKKCAVQVEGRDAKHSAWLDVYTLGGSEKESKKPAKARA